MAKKKEIKAADKEVEMKVVPNTPTDVELNDMKGAVKSVKETYHKAYNQGDKIIRGKREELIGVETNNITFYNELGKMTGRDIFTKEETILKVVYNENGKYTAMISHDKEGNITSTHEYIYDDKDQLSVTRSLNKDGIETNSTEYLRNEKGDSLGHISYMGGVVYGKSTIIYDDNGFKIEDLMEDGIGMIKRRSVYKNNHKGHPVEITVYKEDGSLDNRYMCYDEYDENGDRIIQKEVARRSKEFEENAWERDAFGNWIEKWKYYKNEMINVWVREIVYYGEQPPFKEYLSIVEEIETSVNNNSTEDLKTGVAPAIELAAGELEPALARWLQEASPTPDIFSAPRYYVLKNNQSPSIITFSGDRIEAIALMRELKETMGAKELHTCSEKYDFEGERLTKYTLGFPNVGYVLQATQISHEDSGEYDVPDYIRQIIRYEYSGVYTSNIVLLRPSDGSGKRDKVFERQLERIMSMCSLERIPDKPKIYMIQYSQNFYLKSHAVEDNFEIKDLDLNYGNGFAKFHNELMERFLNESKGLVLFHGEPGTGKTYYIRHLLRSMANNKKIVIYMPPNMVDHLVEPGFMTFVSTQVEHYSRQGYFCVLLIEDAEPLLAKRQEGIRIQGVTNLLNMTDGLLNDMLNLQIICTFNVDLKKLDSALLRPGRLIARKEFKALNELDANLLAQRLGIKHHFKKSATLGEIYSFGKDMSTLIHDVEADRDASTAIDDL